MISPDDLLDTGNTTFNTSISLCSACKAMPTERLYPTADFVIEGFSMTQDGEIHPAMVYNNGHWGLCGVCAELSDQNLAAAMAKARGGDDNPEVILALSLAVVRAFKYARIGEPYWLSDREN